MPIHAVGIENINHNHDTDWQFLGELELPVSATVGDAESAPWLGNSDVRNSTKRFVRKIRRFLEI